MEHWSTDERVTQHSKPLKGKGKTLDLPGDDFWRWPHLDHGMLGRATLVTENNRLKWSTVVDTSLARKITPLVHSTSIFPETRPFETNPPSERLTNTRFQQGLQYLRTYFPDADFPGEVVRDELAADNQVPRGFELSDPLVGNSLELQPSLHSRDRYDVLFPMGDLGRELNVSSLVPCASGGTIFRASGVPSFTFETPILQISVPTLPPRATVLARNIALVRTYTSASLISIASSEGDSHPQVVREADLARPDTGGVPIVDSRILGMGPDVIAVNRVGHVYTCNLGAGKVVQSIKGSRTAVQDSSDVWQLGVTGRDDECYLTSPICVKHLDFRAGDAATVVYSLDSPGVAVTFCEASGQDHLSCITTTNDVVWLDNRFRRHPLLSFKHHRNYDRTLGTSTAQLDTGPLTLLSSRRNGLVTVYDINRRADNLMYCNASPSSLPWEKPVFTAYTGQAVAVSPCGSELSFLRLTQRGSILRQDFRITTSKETEAREERPTHEWNEDVWKLDQRAKDIRPNFGPVAGKRLTEVDLHAAYEMMFSSRNSSDDSSGEAFYDLLDQISTFWQQIEAPIDNILTTFDVAVHLGEEPKIPRRADFFAGCALNCKRGFRAVTQGKLPVQELAGGAPWSYSMLDTMRCLGYDIPNDWSALDERLRKLELRPGADRSAVTLRREREAREQLVVDLALSCDAFSPRPFTKPRCANTEMQFDATFPEAKATSYPIEPPDVEFGYFHPLHKIAAGHHASTNAGDASTCRGDQDTTVVSPLGVRLLLAEWEVGTSVESYTYRDPYGTTEEHQVAIPPRRKQTRPMTQSTVASQRPPTIMTAAMQRPPEKLRREVFAARAPQQGYSQDTAMNPMPCTYSQTMEPSTQVLPGPFGGRPGRAKQMTSKKRMGGF